MTSKESADPNAKRALPKEAEKEAEAEESYEFDPVCHNCSG